MGITVNPSELVPVQEQGGLKVDPRELVPASSGEPAQEKPGKLHSLGVGLVTGATAGFLPKLAGITRAGAESALADNPETMGVFEEYRNKDTTGEYEKYKQEAQGQINKAKEAHPGYFLSGQIMGGVPLAATLPGKGLVGLASQAALGGIEGAGYSEANGLPGLARDIGFGAAGGAAGWAAGQAINKGIEKVAPWLKQKFDDVAASMARRSARATPATFGRVKPEKLQEIGQWLLDEKIPIATPQRMFDATGAVMDRTGPAIRQATIEAGDKAPVSLVDLWGKVMKDRNISELDWSKLSGAPDEITQFFDTMIKNNGGKDIVTPEFLHRMRMAMDKAGVTWGRATDDATNAAWKSARMVVSDELNDAMHIAGMGTGWDRLNKTYELAAGANELAGNGVKRRLGNEAVSPTEKIATIMAIMEAATTHNPAAIAGAGTYSLLNRFGYPAAAKVLHKAGEGPEITGNVISRAVQQAMMLKAAGGM